MSTVQVLAFSSSRVGNGAYLENAVPVIQQFLGDKKKKIAFVPFASVDSYDEYAEKVKTALSTLPHEINAVLPDNGKTVIENADVIMVGGGNTFKLLHDLYAFDLVELIKQKVQNGTPYIGWSAGSNLTGPTICTTNDMPILEPKSFNSFGFFPFQLNPHYYNVVIEGFHGETRDQRLEEYLKANDHKHIMALPEGTWLMLQNDQVTFDGMAQGIAMSREEGQTIHRIIHPGTIL
ncbi:MAG: dipeptidase PepE [Chitinophagaceae bacterium]|nr:MAG: dipeptidase PepE [Chitinophagaceae bacterium]